MKNLSLLFIILFGLSFTSCDKEDEPKTEPDTSGTVTPPANAADPVTDIDGNTYTTVTIGTQVWMAENLKVSKYNDGTSIPNVTDNTAWGNLTTGAWCNYDNDAANGAKLGKMYNWYAVNTGKLAPTGWHVPTDAEWTIMENYLIANGGNYDGTTTNNKIAKALAAKTDWSTSILYTGAIGNDLSKNNSSGFSALPGGFRYSDGTFGDIDNYGAWWSSTEYYIYCSWGRYLYYSEDLLIRLGEFYKENGLSVRCVKD